MYKQLWAKILLIAVMIFFAVVVLYPPDKTLRAGIDLAGGTSLIYEIDTTGLSLNDRKDLASRMIDVLRRRIDPANIRNLIWRPQGDTRFEIQVPLASEEVRSKRQTFENALSSLQADNINPALILQAVKLPAEKRAEYFNKITAGSAAKIETLNNIAKAYDNYYNLRKQSEDLYNNLKDAAQKITAAGLDANQVRANVYDWTQLDETKRQKQLRSFISKDPNAADPNKLELLDSYVKQFSEWASISEQFLSPDKGPAFEFNEAQKQIDRLNLTEERINNILSTENKYARQEEIKTLKGDFPDRSEKIDAVVKAWDAYKPYQGRLDDPKDLQRMLKGAGILEFRILPTKSPTADDSKILSYIERLRTNGPSYASAADNEYIWCQVESTEEIFTKDKNGNPYMKWRDGDGNPAYVETFGGKWYVLASNKPDECLLHNPQNPWKLIKSQPSRDQEGRKAISFELDSKGGQIFAKITGTNIDKPLCILLDNLAISAPNIHSQIYTSGIITGTFSETQQTDMVNKLNAGTLPARLIEPPISEKTIGPSIGADNLAKGIKSGVIGVIIVISFMAVYYTVGGCIADAALFLNLLFTLAVMAFLRATFTLPGIAGAILTIGMSVDANVLIFERIREEQQKGSTIRTAIKNGYEKAFSAIFDSNLTTVISAVVLYWVGSEEIKGFAIVLILGLLSNLFTAVFATRVVFDFLVAKGIMKERLIMLQLIRKPKINWMAYRPVFFTLSAILTIGGLVVFFTRDNTKSNKYDIEFTGGTSVTINLKEGSQLTRQDIEDRIKQTGTELANHAIAASNVWSIGKAIGQKPNGEKIFHQYEITTTETNKSIVKVSFPASVQITDKDIASKIAERLPDASVTAAAGQPNVFEITSTQTNTAYVANVIKEIFANAEISDTQVQETVNNAIIKAFGSDMKILQNLEPQITSVQRIDEKLIESEPQLANFVGGIKITCTLAKPAAADEISSRLQELRFKPDTKNLPTYNYRLFAQDLTELPASQSLNSFVYVSTNEDFAFRQPSEDEWNNYEQTEKTKITTAMQLAESLPRITQISPSVGSEAKTRALLAIILSLLALLVYIWFRFGNFRFGFGAVITLFHDTCVTLGVISVAYYLSRTHIGQALLIGDFKINLAMIAAILTLIGYSLNDSIVIYDRIRENRKRGTLTPQLISDSINDTLSRTLLTGGTTLIVVWIMYIFGGEGLRGFNYAMGLGIIIGTYSSIAISAPVLLFTRQAKSQEKKLKP